MEGIEKFLIEANDTSLVQNAHNVGLLIEKINRKN